MGLVLALVLVLMLMPTRELHSLKSTNGGEELVLCHPRRRQIWCGNTMAHVAAQSAPTCGTRRGFITCMAHGAS